MAYSTNPNLPKARAIAMRLLVIDQLPVTVVARNAAYIAVLFGAGSVNGTLSIGIFRWTILTVRTGKSRQRAVSLAFGWLLVVGTYRPSRLVRTQALAQSRAP